MRPEVQVLLGPPRSPPSLGSPAGVFDGSRDQWSEMRVLTLGPTDHDRVVLFAAGAGGDPERHRPLLEHLAVHDCRVIAPCFERLAVEATTAELLTRPVGLIEALHRWASPDAAVVLAGH